MKYAAIDVGTNTVLLLIMEELEGLRDVLDLSTIVKLGEGLANSGRLSRPAMSRTLDAMKRYVEIALSHRVDKIFCVGTASLREASNSWEFLDEVKKALGFDVEIISTEREAYYTYLSVRDDRRVKSTKMVIVDIGGGSTEIIFGRENEFTGYVSLSVGSVKLTDAFITCDPPVGKELDMAVSRIKEELSLAPCPDDGGRLIGTGGTVTNIASIMMDLEGYDKDRVHGYPIGLKQLEELMAALASRSSRQRKMMKGMEAGRENIILQGALILREIMAHGGFENCVVSVKGVRYGVIYEKCGKQGPGERKSLLEPPEC